jgi:hypothetical protein
MSNNLKSLHDDLMEVGGKKKAIQPSQARNKRDHAAAEETKVAPSRRYTSTRQAQDHLRKTIKLKNAQSSKKSSSNIIAVGAQQ